MDPDALVKVTFAGLPFRVNPLSVRWDWTVKTAAEPTLGGKVIQVFGVDPGDIIVSGTFGIGGWEEQQRFLERMKRLADASLDPNPKPIRFIWPGQGWDFQVFLKAFRGDGPASIQLSNTSVAPGWQLELDIVEDNLRLRQVAADLYIARLSEGIGWKQTQFNGGFDLADMQEAISRAGVSTLQDYFAVAYGLSGGVPLGNIPAGTSSGVPGDRVLSMVEVALVAKNAGFMGEPLAIAVAIAQAESGLNPRALRAEKDNPLGGRDRGLWQINSKANPQYPNDEEMFDPDKNAAAAWALSNGGTNWKPWYKKVTKLARINPYLPEAREAARAVGGL